MSVFLSVSLSVCLSVFLSVYLYFCLSVCLSVCISVCQSTCLFVFSTAPSSVSSCNASSRKCFKPETCGTLRKFHSHDCFFLSMTKATPSPPALPLFPSSPNPSLCKPGALCGPNIVCGDGAESWEVSAPFSNCVSGGYLSHGHFDQSLQVDYTDAASPYLVYTTQVNSAFRAI